MGPPFAFPLVGRLHDTRDLSIINTFPLHRCFFLLAVLGHAKARLIQMLPHGTRVCLTATLLDGLVLSLVAFHHSMNYRSAVLHGEVEEIDDGSGSDGGLDGERWEAGKQVVEKVLPGRWEDARQPTKAEMKATGFVKVKILSAR